MNFCNAKCYNNNAVFIKAGRPNLLGENLIKKVKDIPIGTRAAVINKKQILNIARRVSRTNVQTKMEWTKRKRTIKNVEPSPRFKPERNSHSREQYLPLF